MSNIVAISANEHTFMARIPGTGRTCKIWHRGEVIVGASCNTRNQLHRIKSFVSVRRVKTEHASDYVERVWKEHLAAHLREQIDPELPEVRFEILVATGPHLYLIKHLPEAGGYSSMRAHHRAATQYWVDGDLCEASFELTKKEDVLLRLSAALVAGANGLTARDIAAGQSKIQVFVT